MGISRKDHQRRILLVIIFASFWGFGFAWTSPGNPVTTPKSTCDGQVSRKVLFNILHRSVALGGLAFLQGDQPSFAEDGAVITTQEPPKAVVMGDAKKLFNDGRVFEQNGNIGAAQRLYLKVTRIEPRFVYGWSNLGNTQVALGDLGAAEGSYTTAIDLCKDNIDQIEKGFGARKCDDLYILLLNRGSLRLNNGMPKEALEDLSAASALRGRPDAIILQNLARAREINGFYKQADRDYTLAISMTANEVNPFWLRSALVKLELGDVQSGFDLLKRVNNRFPEAPEVRAAYATFLAALGDQVAAQQKYLEIPDRQREKYVQDNYLRKVISWPPAAIDQLSKVAAAAGDKRA